MNKPLIKHLNYYHRKFFTKLLFVLKYSFYLLQKWIQIKKKPKKSILSNFEASWL